MASAPVEEWTVGKLLNWTAEYFRSKDVEEPLLSAQLLLAKALGCSKVDLYLRYDQEVSAGERAVFRELVRRATRGEPIAYLIGTKEFFSLEFAVSSAVLIPRPETELLVQWIIRKVRSDAGTWPGGPVRVLELGTGSGCVAVSLAKFLPQACKILATDISTDALAQARENCIRHGVRDSVQLLAGDLFASILPVGTFDFVVGNLPYVSEDDYGRLPRHIRYHEPREALAGGPDGLEVLRRVIAQAGQYLHRGGYLVLEIGYNQSDRIAGLLYEHDYKEIMFEKDHAEIVRVAIARAPETN